jgi:hypothetical protein
MNAPTRKRALAIDPMPYGFGFVVAEGPDFLLDWGIRHVKVDKNGGSLRLIGDLIERYRPDVIVTEDAEAKGSRRCPRVKRLLGDVADLASAKGIASRAFSRIRARRTFASEGAATKDKIARAIAARHPELAPRLPPVRKCWMAEDPRMSIFDAASLVLTYFHTTGRPKQAA